MGKFTFSKIILCHLKAKSALNILTKSLINLTIFFIEPIIFPKSYKVIYINSNYFTVLKINSK